MKTQEKHRRIRAASLLIMGLVTNAVEPNTSKAQRASATCGGGCVDVCPGNLQEYCGICSPVGGAICYIDSGCDSHAPGRWLVVCNPI
jgi:hypothetical protein